MVYTVSMENAYLTGVRCALKKLGADIAGTQNPRITSQDELGQYLSNTYNNTNPGNQPPPAGLGTRPATKLSLYTSWSREEPALRNIGTEDQGTGLQGGNETRSNTPTPPTNVHTKPTVKLSYTLQDAKKVLQAAKKVITKRRPAAKGVLQEQKQQQN